MVGSFPQDHTFHQEVEDQLAMRNALNTKDKLSSLRNMRRNADYNTKMKIRKEKAKFAIVIANQAITTMINEII